MEDSEMDMPTEQTLHRKYLVKIKPELRIRVLSKEWEINGEARPPRMPTTHREIAQAVGLLLEEKADIDATGHGAYDTLMNIDGGGPVLPRATQRSGAQAVPQSGGATVQFGHCKAVDSHHTVVCHQKASHSV
jgi:hypothetical protein